MYLIYVLTGLCGGILIGLAGLTAAMVLTPILSGVCGWSGYNAVTMSLVANVPSAMVTAWTYYKNGNVDRKQGSAVSVSAFLGAVAGSYLGYLFSRVSENGVSYLVILGNLVMAIKFLKLTGNKQKLRTVKESAGRKKMILALALAFLIGAECGFMGSAGGIMMLMVLTLVLGMNTKLAVGTGSLIMALVALTGAMSHLMMGAVLELLPAAVLTLSCTAGAVGSARFANRVDDKIMNRCAGVILILISAVSLLLSPGH